LKVASREAPAQLAQADGVEQQPSQESYGPAATWTYWSSPIGLKTPGERAVSSRATARRHVREHVGEVARVEGDRRAVAFDRSLDLTDMVADLVAWRDTGLGVSTDRVTMLAIWR
jgi:hypothetical protein